MGMTEGGMGMTEQTDGSDICLCVLARRQESDPYSPEIDRRDACPTDGQAENISQG